MQRSMEVDDDKKLAGSWDTWPACVSYFSM